VDAKSQRGDVAPPTLAGPGREADAAIDPRDVLRNDPTIAKKLVGYAYKKTSDIARAKDAAQEAVARMLESKGFYRWDPSRKTLLNHLADIVDTVVANENRRAAAWREEPLKPARDKRTADPRPDPERKMMDIEEEQRRQRLADAVMMRVEKDPLIPRMLELAQEGTDDAAEQAGKLGCRVPDIYRARERLAHHRDAVLDQEKRNGGAR
jgi:DNA-directed RNA polymerase specialized sigma24 family protein